jgi:hypothetical protein
MNRIYHDSEFTGLHRNSTYISLAFISESGNYFYAEFTDYDKNQVNDWIQKEVIGHLIHSHGNIEDFSYLLKSLASNNHSGVKQYNIEMVGTREDIKKELHHWLETEAEILDTDQVQIYTDCYAYDWILFVDLLSKDDGVNKSAMGMPKFINYIPIDLSTLLWANDIDPDISREEFAGIKAGDKDIMDTNISATPELSSSKHNAFFDTMIIKECFEKLDKMKIDGK